MSKSNCIAAAICCLLICGSTASARPIGGAPIPTFFSPARVETAAPRVEESRPAIFFLPDKNGNLQPVLDFRYEDFEKLYKLKHGLSRRVEPPRYVLQRMTAVGRAIDARAELNVEFQILLRSDEWTRIPLRLDQAMPHGDVKYKGDGRQFITCDEKDGGYLLWIQGKAGSLHKIALTVLVPLELVGDETRLKLSSPRATASEMKLTVPVAGAIATASDGAAVLSTTTAEDGATEYLVGRLTGEFQLSWSKPVAEGADAPAAVLESVGSVLTRFDGRGVYSEATLSVRSLGAEFDRFTVRLPPGAELVPLPAAEQGYALAPVTTDGEDDGKSVEVRLAKKSAGPVEVRIACRRDVEQAGEESWIELAGFDVAAAARQWGTIAVATDGRRQVLWGNNRRVAQIEQIPDTMPSENVLAAFEYHGQPFSLAARQAPRKTRVTVEPEYILSVDESRIRLDAKLIYSIRGAEVLRLKLSLPGWRLIEAGPEHIVASDGVTDEGGEVTIPLARPMSGSVELRLSADRKIGAKPGSLSVPLPVLEVDSLRPAACTVLPADNVKLIPDEERLTGMSPRAGPPSTAASKGQQKPLYYLVTGDRPVFAAELRVLKRHIAVAVAGHIAMADGTAAVRQKFSYFIHHEPAGRLKLLIPRRLTAPGRMSIVCDGMPLTPSIVDKDAIGGDPLAEVAATVILPEPKIGECELLLSYSTAFDEPSAEQPAVATIPLAMPADGDLTGNELAINTSRSIDPRLLNEGWSEADGGDRQGDLRLTADSRRYSLDIDLHSRGGTADEIVVDRVWMQTRFDADSRQDRAVFRLNTDQSEIEAILPAGAAIEQAAVLVNGLPVRPRISGKNRLLIPLGSRGDTSRATIELRCHFPGARPPRGALKIDLPRLAKKAWIRRAYWQLVLPPNEHLISSPSGWTGEYDWRFNGTFWGREQSIDQTELETWAGAAAGFENLGRANRYLFSAIGAPPPANMRTADRTWIVLWASAAALIGGLLLIHVPFFRRPWLLFASGVSLLAAGFIAPEPTLLAAQAAAIGLALALLAGLMQRGVRGRKTLPARKDHSSSRIEVGSSRIAAASGEVPSTRQITPPATGNPER